MTKNKENIAAAQALVEAILAKNFNQKVSKKSSRAAAERLLESVPTARPSKEAQAA